MHIEPRRIASNWDTITVNWQWH